MLPRQKANPTSAVRHDQGHWIAPLLGAGLRTPSTPPTEGLQHLALSVVQESEEAAVNRPDLAKNRYRQLPMASELGSVLVRHSLAAGGCCPKVTRENDGSGSSLLWVAVKRYSHHALQAYLKATRSAGGFFTTTEIGIKLT